MSYGRSRFYNNIYVPFRDGRYDDALNSATRYYTRQTSAGFRRIYESLIKTIDVIKREGTETREEKGQVKSRLLLQLARLDITIEYQKNRGTLDADLADGIKAALAEIRRDLGTEKAVREAEALELALNAVLAYQIVAERKRREEEEWL
jgi:CRISPR/Cas system CSM-associated protein Csm2 small subunit